jgi:chemotaxis regulatin CheY-phosphate phosphatase CheZ
MLNAQGGKFDKFLVINRKFLQFLSITDQLNLHKMMNKVNKKIPDVRDKRYIVINTDEPYAEEVIEIMKKHGHWD